MVTDCSDFMAIYLIVVEILNFSLNQSGGPTDSQTDAVVCRRMPQLRQKKNNKILLK